MSGGEIDPIDRRGVWAGIKRCGCVVGMVRDEHRTKDTLHEQIKMLKQGLSVMYATRAEWDKKYLPSFLKDCPHGIGDPKPSLEPAQSADAVVASATK